MRRSTIAYAAFALLAPPSYWYLTTCETRSPVFDPMRCLAMVVFSVGSVIDVLAVFAGLIFSIYYSFSLNSDLRMRSRMIAKDRWLARAVVKQAALDAGTLIIVEHLLSSRNRIWWTCDDVLAIAPMPQPPEEEQLRSDDLLSNFERWMIRRYLDPDLGSATLLSIWIGRDRQTIRARFPHMKIVTCSSFFEHTAEWMNIGPDGMPKLST